ncbi:asparagine synthase (glutamine-hydrolyzing) [Mucilaginibacter pallidiroseus]|uniref:asparagine synthase (glutamine-hydrolyzing) n=1 Tax=Mucilaginibacter pallidiroseus TaxID=2599295 RepID=A0A563U0L3_9SPHI|nr:asparagine synthase (glutamine-hydrolyzing) [Mucilaginibacter pallidiroseus]TWR25167.1 asparagine synthase (glutamine-hydrolyzing) [Mucilaginibacter pallidiroseus]
MCRIAGIISNSFSSTTLKEKVQAMCTSMCHGGPDDEGVIAHENANLVFGHRRLSIIDLSGAGHQPMADVNELALITFNGEIYNYRELKAELQGFGAVFQNQTDTEVILQAYLKWGIDCFSKFRGIFAFALFDIKKSTTYLVRDANGVKPLYYYHNDEVFAFASEIKAFIRAGVTHQHDERWPIWLLAFGNIPEPYTTLKNVFSLPKGSYLSYSLEKGPSINSYENVAHNHLLVDEREAQEGICHHLNNAVKRQLISDAPIGVFLSGGTDSSILTLLAAKQHNKPVKTISLFFNEKEYDESRYQTLVAGKLPKDDFHSHLTTSQDFDTHLPQIIGAMDMPTTDGINSWFISKYASETGFKAVLSGIGADELFGGYPSFERISYLRYARMFPKNIYWLTNLLQNNKLKRLLYLQQSNTAADYLFLRGLFTPVDIAKLLNTTEQQANDVLFKSFDFPIKKDYNKLDAAWFEKELYMQNQLLRDTDVMSMRHGLEVRVPFLDEDFQTYVNSITPAVRFKGPRPKQLLIDSFRDILPNDVWSRKKMGFSFPLQEWMGKNQQVTNEEHYKGTAAKQAINKFKQGKIHWSRAFALYQVQKHV